MYPFSSGASGATTTPHQYSSSLTAPAGVAPERKSFRGLRGHFRGPPRPLPSVTVPALRMRLPGPPCLTDGSRPAVLVVTGTVLGEVLLGLNPALIGSDHRQRAGAFVPLDEVSPPELSSGILHSLESCPQTAVFVHLQ